MKRTNIDLELTLRAPLHIACTRAAHADPDNLRARNGKGEEGKGVPVTGTQHMRVVLPAGGEHKTADVPMIPSNLIRGRLRRIAAQKIMDLVHRGGEVLTIDAQHLLTTGAVTGQPQGTLTLDEADRAARHPYMGLFGGGPRMVTSALTTSIAYPVCLESIQAKVLLGHENEEATTAISAWMLTRIIFFRRVDDSVTFANLETLRSSPGYADELRAWVDAVSDNRKVGEDGEKNKKLAIAGWNCTEVVIPGTRMRTRLSVDDSRAPLASLGLMLECVQTLALEQRLGGWTRGGYGLFDTEATVGDEALFVDGTPQLNRDSEVIGGALEAWDEAKASINAADIEYFAHLDKSWRKEASPTATDGSNGSSTGNATGGKPRASKSSGAKRGAGAKAK